MAAGNSPPITPAAFQVLLALAGGRAHGYRIMGLVNEITGGAVQLGPGTLYRTLARLAADGLVEEASDMSEAKPHDARRRYYQITERGLQVATREAKLLEMLTAAATQAGLLGVRAQSA